VRRPMPQHVAATVPHRVSASGSDAGCACTRRRCRRAGDVSGPQQVKASQPKVARSACDAARCSRAAAARRGRCAPSPSRARPRLRLLAPAL
jgi:hypothetical protein